MITDDFQPTFRVFVSSTFEDFRVERDVLRAGAFRDLEAYCAEHGCSFQAVDLRWGIDTEASIQQRTMRTCLDELKLCQMLSPRPNFLVLLGERYGWVPLPEEIPGDEMERLKLHLSPEWQGRVCDGIYKLDQNSLAPGGVYELQPRSGTYALDRASWAKEVEAPLRTVLFQAASKSGLTGAALAKYHASATEQEIMAGALSPDGAEEHVIFYERLVERSTPVDPSSPVERLKDKLRGRLGKRARDYKAGDLPASVTDPAMAAFNKAVKLDLMTIIQAEIARRKLLDTRHATEAAWLEALREGAESLAGRESECEVLVKACAVAEGGVHLVIGRPGIGKSALLWRVAHLLSEGGDGALLLGCRCGSRPSLFDTAGVFGALESQILQSQGKPPATFESGGIDKMLSFLQTVTPVSRERRVFVILDGADLLGQDADAVHLPMVLKALARQHIHVICAMRAGELATRMTEEAGNGSALNLGSLNRAVAKPLLERWLAERGRKTTPAQSEHVLRAFDGAGSPFWLRIATDIAATWEHDVTPEALPSEERDLLALLLRRLSSARGHGPVLTERTVETLAALQTGIPESDLMELLSADSAVMREFRERHPNSPATDSLAPIVWTRLRRDLEPLLERSQTHGALLLHFAHSQVQDVVRTKAGHAGTWITSRQALVSWLANARPVSAWALAEHDFLLEQLGEHARLARLLSEPCHLELRCRARQVGSVLLSLAKLGTTYPATDQWLQRLQRHSADLATGKLSIFTLLSIEAPSELASLREAHPNGLPGTGYFELNQLWSAQTISEGPVLEPTHTLPVAEPFHVITTATQPPSVFRYLGHGIVDHRGFAPGVQAR